MQFVELAEYLFRQINRREGDRHRVSPDLGIGAHALGDAERMLEQAVENRVDRFAAARLVVGFLELAEDLRFADDHRIEPGGDAEQVARDFLVVVLVNVG